MQNFLHGRPSTDIEPSGPGTKLTARGGVKETRQFPGLMAKIRARGRARNHAEANSRYLAALFLALSLTCTSFPCAVTASFCLLVEPQ
eukprot:3024979-Rhodomonas_salina.1